MFRWFSEKRIIQLNLKHPKNAFETVVSKRDWSVGKVFLYAAPIIPTFQTSEFREFSLGANCI
jgi:hypothetical protein